MSTLVFFFFSNRNHISPYFISVQEWIIGIIRVWKHYEEDTYREIQKKSLHFAHFVVVSESRDF